MLRRGVLAFLLAFAIGASPIVSTLCRAICAPPGATASHAATAEHQCCPPATSLDGQQGRGISGLGHDCGQPDSAPVTADHLPQLTVVLAIAAETACIIAPPTAPALHRAPGHVSRPPRLLTLATPLRV